MSSRRGVAIVALVASRLQGGRERAAEVGRETLRVALVFVVALLITLGCCWLVRAALGPLQELLRSWLFHSALR